MQRNDTVTRPLRAIERRRPLRGALFVGTLALVLASLPAPHAFGDGVFIPPADTRIPGEPLQRALVVHRDGLERLVVESVALAEVAGDHAWILPVPAAPSRLEAVHPDTLAALDLLVGPEIVTEWGKSDPYPNRDATILMAVVATCLSLFFFSQQEGKWRLLSITMATAFLIVGTLLSHGFVRARSAGPPDTSGGSNLFEGRVGSYEVIVCDVPDAAALGERMRDAGLGPIPPEVAKLADDYAREGWKFVVARLAAAGSGPLAPHPLLVEFACERPVFPLRLTAASGSRTNVRLWVATDEPVRCDRLETVLRHRFALESPAPKFGYPHPLLRSQTEHSIGIAHPELLGLIVDRPWSNGPWITRLEGDLRPEEMDRDLALEPIGPNEGTEATPYRKKLYTGPARRALALQFALPFYSAGAILSAFAFGATTGRKRNVRRYVAGLGVATVLAGAIFFVRLSGMPRHVLPEGVRFRPEPGSGLWTPLDAGYVWIEAIDETFDHGPEMRPPAEVTDGELLAMVEAKLVRQWNPVLGRAARPSTLPYDYQIVRDGPEGPVVTVVDEHGGREVWNLRAEYAMAYEDRNPPSADDSQDAR